MAPPAPDKSDVFYLFKTNEIAGPIALGGEFEEILETSQAGSQKVIKRGKFFLTREVPVLTALTIPTAPAPLEEESNL